jgi:hypothetical protein
MRVPPVANAEVWAHGRLLPPDLTVVEAGLSALDRVDVVPETEPT